MRKPFLWLSLAGALLSAHICADPSALWHIVHEQCVPNQIRGMAPAPCAAVNLEQGEDKGYAVLKSRDGVLQYLLIPTARVGGMESPALLAADAPDYWGEAWQARSYMSRKYGKAIPREDISLAINSAYGRSQDQLHIHISCVSKSVYQSIDAIKNRLDAHWQALPDKLLGHAYLARRLDAQPGDVISASPFKLLANEIPLTQSDMGHYTLAMLADTFGDGKQGFVLLADHTDLANGDRGSAEELQDHACAVLQ